MQVSLRGNIIRSKNGSISHRAASDYFLSPPPIFYREAILRQCEASSTPRCDSEHTPVCPANDTPHLRQPTAHYPQSSSSHTRIACSWIISALLKQNWNYIRIHISWFY